MNKSQSSPKTFLNVPRSNIKLEPLSASPMTSTLKRKEINEKELKRKEKQEEFRQQMNNNSEGVWNLMDGMNNKIAKIDSLVNKYQNEMEYINIQGIISHLKKSHEFYTNNEDFDPTDPQGQRTYANQYIYRKKLPTSFYYIERQKIRENIQINTQFQFFHPEWFQHKQNEKRSRQDIDYLKLLAQRKEVMHKEPAPKHIPLNLELISKNRKNLLDEFYAKDAPNKVQRIAELQKKIIPESDYEKIEEIKKKHEEEKAKGIYYNRFSSQNYL